MHEYKEAKLPRTTHPKVHEHHHHEITNIGFGLVTVSDTRTKEEDLSGQIIHEKIESSGHPVVRYEIVKDDSDQILDWAEEMLSNPKVDIVIFCGGTGIAKRDVTYETIHPIMDKELPGFGEIFRNLSYEEIGSRAMLTRATAGIVGAKAVFCLPGSKNAVKLAMDIILEQAGHLLWEARR